MTTHWHSYPWCRGKQTALCPAQCWTWSPWRRFPVLPAAEERSPLSVQSSCCSCPALPGEQHRWVLRIEPPHPGIGTSWKHKNKHLMTRWKGGREYMRDNERERSVLMKWSPHRLEERSDWELVWESGTRAWGSTISSEAEALFESRTKSVSERALISASVITLPPLPSSPVDHHNHTQTCLHRVSVQRRTLYFLNTSSITVHHYWRREQAKTSKEETKPIFSFSVLYGTTVTPAGHPLEKDLPERGWPWPHKVEEALRSFISVKVLIKLCKNPPLQVKVL